MTCRFWVCKLFGHRLISVTRFGTANVTDVICSRTGRTIS